MTKQECLKLMQKAFREAELALGIDEARIKVINAEPAGKFILFTAKIGQGEPEEEKTFLVMNNSISDSAKSILLQESAAI